ncbi:hypothetical protein GKR62_07785 [Yersinia pseudotuberculosis]|nr:hypothetical protein [Yersinia pseudotuberculosis]
MLQLAEDREVVHRQSFSFQSVAGQRVITALPNYYDFALCGALIVAGCGRCARGVAYQ